MRMWLRMAPRARLRPISRRRSSTEMIMVLATPIPPTSRAIDPTPASRLVKAWSAAFLAASASEGREILTDPGIWGEIVGPIRLLTRSTAESSLRS